MKAIKSYSKSFSIGLKSLKLNSIIYVLFLVVSLLLTIPFYRLVVSVTENNLLSDILMDGFNATAFGDILRADGKMFMIYLKGLWPWLLAFWLMGIYCYGAIVSWIGNPRGPFKLKTSIQSANLLFWPYLKLSVYFVILQVIFGILVYILPSILIGQENLTDDYVVRTMSIGILIHLFFLISLSFVADISRYAILQSSKRNVIKIVWKSLGFVIHRFASFWLMFLLWMILPLITIIGFILFRNQFQANSTSAILILFLIQQVVVWMRFLFRIKKQGLFYSFYMLNQVAD